MAQTASLLENESNIEGMMKAEKLHKMRFNQLAKQLRLIWSGEGNDRLLFLGAGACDLCSSCACPDNPYHPPSLAYASMEAAGLAVGDVCEKPVAKTTIVQEPHPAQVVLEFDYCAVEFFRQSPNL